MTTPKSLQCAVALMPPTAVTVPARAVGVSLVPRVGAGPALPPGTVIGDRYRLLALVEQGGMGAIYTAQDRRLDRRVAVKMMLAEVAARPGFAERFEREAKLTASINHPNCVAAYDYGVDSHGHYLVLEWVEGRTLEALVMDS